MLNDDVAGAGAAGAGAGGDKGGAGAAGAGGTTGAAAGAGGAAADEPSLIGGAGAKKEGDEQTPEAKAAAEKAAGEKTAAARASIEKEFAKDLEGKTDAEKKAIVDKKLADKDAAEAAKAGGAPEKYDVKLPEGFEKDEPVMAKFLDIARKFNLSNDKAQELVDFQAEVERSRADAADAEFNSRAKAWREETVKNSGKNFEADQADVGRFVETFGGPGLRKLMDATRIGENWELFSAMAKAGAKLKEAQPPEGGANGKEPDQGKRWYGDSMDKAMQSRA